MRPNYSSKVQHTTQGTLLGHLALVTRGFCATRHKTPSTKDHFFKSRRWSRSTYYIQIQNKETEEYILKKKTKTQKISKRETSILIDEEFEATVIKMLSEFRKRLDELSDNFFNKETENIENNQSELKNIITKMKNTLETINIRLDDAEIQSGNQEDKVVEITYQTSKINTQTKTRTVYATSETLSSIPTCAS